MKGTFDARKMIELRKTNNLTQKQLADLTGLSLSAIQGYEQGRYEPKADPADRIARALGVSFSDLHNEPGTMSFESPLDFWVSLIRSGREPELNVALSRKAAALVLFDDLNEAGQRYALSLLEVISKVPEYQKN